MDDTLSTYMKNDHRACDRLLAACEAAAGERNWLALGESAAVFSVAMERHFRMEEEVLFPELERAVAQSHGPTGVMRMEHRQMRQQLADLATAVRDRDRDGCLGILDTLHIFAQQHNAKEEGVLYPLADRSLLAAIRVIYERLQGL